MRSRTTLGLLLVLALATPAAAGEIRGTLRLPDTGMDVTTSPNPYPGTARAMAMPHHTQRGLASDAVIWVEEIPAGADPPARSPAPRLAQKDQAFAPRVLPVAVGTAVDFPNLDPIYHNVFSLSPVRRFDLGKYPRGHSKRVVFDRTGLVNVYCDIHSDMEAFVLVLPHHVFTQPDANGDFHLPPLPAGHYVLRMWHPDRPGLRRDVEVPADGAVTVDLRP